MPNIGNLNGKILSVLIDFNFLIDIDIGLIRFIREEFQDSRAFKLDILNKSDREILSLLYSRINWNPLSIISTNENLSDIDELYKSFIDTYKDEILHRSITYKDINEFIGLVFSNVNKFGINPIIYTRDDLEKREINRFFDINKTTNDIKLLSSKEVFYVKDYIFFTENNLTNLTRKKIYISPRRYNVEYLQNSNTNLSKYNDFISIGRDYSKRENKDGSTKSNDE